MKKEREEMLLRERERERRKERGEWRLRRCRGGKGRCGVE
jgi:hypothetical protein